MALDQGENDQTGRVSPVSTAFDGAGFVNNTSLAQAGFRAKDAKMNASDIKDDANLDQWLRTRKRSDSVIVASRIAQRVAPIYFEKLFQEEAQKKGLICSKILRLLITSSVACKFPNADICAASAHADAASNFSAPSSGAFGHACSVLAAADHASEAAASAAHASAEYGAFVWGAIRSDCSILEQGLSLEGASLWSGQGNQTLAEWYSIRTHWQKTESPYAFWLRWYEAALKGNSLNPELERDIALIPDADWEKGAEHVAVIIAQIEERHDLKAQVVALREQLTLIQAEAATAAHRSHNQPPELLDAAPELQRQITIIFDALDEAETELSQTAPAPSRLKRIGQALMDAIIAIAKYCGGIANKAIVAAAVAGGTAVGGLGVAKLLELAAPTQTLGQSILDYASRLIGG